MMSEQGQRVPFDVIVVTSPNETAARAAQSGPLKSLRPLLNDDTLLLSTCDPYNVQCGSGGGTLAALRLAHEQWSFSNPPSVLVLHAGGQSSRCPTQMVLGKAWTSLPILRNEESSMIGNPTILLMQRLFHIYQGIPHGTVVVAASDVLLSLPITTEIDFTIHDNSVIGLAVPARLETATNHGVFVLDNIDIHDNHNCNTDGIRPVSRFLQKPSRETLLSHRGALTGNDSQAWIDTGVICFLPKAATTLLTLSEGLLKCCTKQGLDEIYIKQQEHHEDFNNFCKAVSVKVELYSHLLMALRTTRSQGLEEYMDLMQNDKTKVPIEKLEGIYDALSQRCLVTLAIPEGSFVHLGTTRELMDFVLCSTNHSMNGLVQGDEIQEVPQKQVYHKLGKDMQMIKRAGTFLEGNNVSVDSSTVMLNTMICTSNERNCTIGPGSLVEHSSLVCHDGLSIGSNCLVSSVRGECCTRLDIPSNMCLQMVQLSNGNNRFYVLESFGVYDDIQKCRTLYGVNVENVLNWSGLHPHDLWENDMPVANRKVWNAKLHPIVVSGTETDIVALDFESLFSWVSALLSGRADTIQQEEDPCCLDSLERWKSTRRLSLEDIRQMANAEAEFRYRSHLSDTIIQRRRSLCNNLERILLDRRHVECMGLDQIVETYGANMALTEDLWDVLKALDQTIHDGLTSTRYDVSSRAFMVMSALFSDLAAVMQPQKNEQPPIEATVERNINMLRSSSATDRQRIEACDAVFSHRDATLKKKQESPFGVCCNIMENAALALVQQCVGSSTSIDDNYQQRTRPPVPTDTWVVASAPVRIDLAGGWSDTPPLSYEYGGAVACLAVTVDGRKPLSSKCRIVSGSKGLILSTENRYCSSGILLSERKVRIDTVGGLADYKNPQADCALIKCALVFFGLVSKDEIHDCDQDEDLQPHINRFCESDVDVGMEIVSTSFLPHGSGMGTSSILGGCVLAAIGRCIGVDMADATNNSNDFLVHAVLMLEQLLSTGGGWQDQVGGLYGGLKLGTSHAYEIPLKTKVQHIPMSTAIERELSKRLLLVYTGRTRIAKNILQTVLRRWARRSPDIVETVQDLVAGANDAAAALQQGDLDKVGECLNSYWQQKKTMAGDDSGAEPAVVKEVLQELLRRQVIVAGSLCGAGGGGFMVLLAAAGRNGSEIGEIVEKDLAEMNAAVFNFTWHQCNVSQDGLTVGVGGSQYGNSSTSNGH